MKRFSSHGFALPTVLIASVVMMIILATSVAGTVATRTSIKAQQYDQLSSVAAESGLAMATACIKSGVTTWANPLRPGSTCSGRAASTTCNTPDCYVMQSDGSRTTFEVNSPVIAGDATTIESKGTTQLIRTSNQQVWRTYNQVLRRQEVSSGILNVQWRQISSYNQNVCAVSYTDQLYCWGPNASGQIGDGTTTARTEPTLVSRGSIPTDITIQSVAVGSASACALASNNEAYCWGSNSNGQLGDATTTNRLTPSLVAQGDRPAGVSFQKVEVGGSHACGIGSNGIGYCWGLSSNGQLGVNSTAQRLVPTYISQGAIPVGATLKQIALGDTHSCAIASNDLMYCWGNNVDGQLGINSTSQRLIPTAVVQGSVPTGVFALSIYAEGLHTCAIGTNYLAYCWGNNVNGQVGNNSAAVRRVTPAAVSLGSMPSGTTIQSLGLGSQHTCALASNNLTYCWGLNSSSQLGNGATTNQIIPVAVNQSSLPSGVLVRQIDSGDTFTCVLGSNNLTYCLGNNDSGSFGASTPANSLNFVQTTTVALNATAPLSNTFVAGSGSSTCSIGSDVRTYCWGSNSAGQLGDNTFTDRSLPTPVSQGAIPSGVGMKQLSVFYDGACAVGSDNRGYCWGSGSGALGNGGSSGSALPVAVSQGALPTNSILRQISRGSGNGCAIASDGKAYCWGVNSSGQLGNASTTSSNVPVAVSQGAMPAGGIVRQLSSGFNYNCTVAMDTRAYCWGVNSSGQLGNASTTSSNVPVAVSQGAMPAIANIQQIVTGTSHSCIVAADGKAYCWGSNSYGELGNGTTSASTSPVAVSQGAMPSGVTVRQIAVGSGYTCVVASDYKAYCWGLNISGRLGNGSTTDSTLPVSVLTGAKPNNVGIKSIGLGNDHGCVVAHDAKTYCWGFNNKAQLGDTTTTNRTSPIEISSLPLYPSPSRIVRYF